MRDVAVLLSHDPLRFICAINVLDDLAKITEPVFLYFFFAHIGLRMPIPLALSSVHAVD